jgi:hypothetical protein
MSGHFGLVVPSHTVRFYEKGEHCTDPQNGDILLVDHGSIASTLIEDLEKLATIREPALRGFTWCGHVGIIRTDLGPETIVSEMGFKGYERRPFLDYKERLGAVVNLRIVPEQRAAMSAFDDAMVGAEYGWLEYPSIVADDVTGLGLSASYADHVICSAHAMIVGGAAGFMGDRLPVRVEPMRIAMWLGAKRP